MWCQIGLSVHLLYILQIAHGNVWPLATKLSRHFNPETTLRAVCLGLQFLSEAKLMYAMVTSECTETL